MEIRMKTLMAGPAVVRQPGETCVVTAEEGEMLVSGGYAEMLGKPAQKTAKAHAEPEPAVPVSPETADTAEDHGRKTGRKS